MTKKERNSIIERLMKRVKKQGDCWIWSGATCYTKSNIRREYGFMVIDYKRHSVRRLAYLVFRVSPALGNHTVDSTCGNSLCINPSHLVSSNRTKSNGPTRKVVE